MLYYQIITCIMVAILIIQFLKGSAQIGGGSKCYSCEGQDFRNGIYRDYGSKCFSCESQDRRYGIVRNYGAKLF